MTDTVDGVPVAADDPLVAAKNELTLVKSLTRIGGSARFTVSTVSVIGTALTALGLVTADLLTARPLPRLLAIAGTTLAVLAVVFALLYLAVRLEKLNVENYDEVRAWYRNQFRRAWLVVAASWLLVGAAVLAGAAGIAGVVTADDIHDPVLTLVVEGTGRERTVTARAVAGRLNRGEVATMRVTNGPGALQGTTLLVGSATADAGGKVTLDASVDKAPALPAYRLSLAIGGAERASVNVP